MADGRVFVIGWRLRQRSDRESRAATGTQIALAYDSAKDSWTQLAEPPAPRADASLVALHDGRVLMAGGLANTPSGPKTVRRVDIYDPKTDRWHRASPLPKGRSRAALVTLQDGRILAVGGVRKKYGGVKTALNALLYDVEDDHWEKLGNSRFGYFGTRTHAFALPDGDALFVGGCSPPGGGSIACPVRRIDLATGDWHDVSHEFGISSVATRLPDGRIFLFDGYSTAGIYDPGEVADEGTIHELSQADNTLLGEVSEIFAIDETSVVFVSPLHCWAIDFSDIRSGKFSVATTFDLPIAGAQLGSDAKPSLELTAVAPGDAFALLHAWDDRLDFIGDQPVALRLSVSTNEGEAPKFDGAAAEQSIHFTPIPVTAANPVPSVEQGLGPIQTRTVYGQLDWLAVAWGAGKNSDWIAERLAFSVEGTNIRTRAATDGVVRPQQVVADFDDDGGDDLAIRFHAGCGNEFAAKWCVWVTAYVPASGGWAVLGMTGENDAVVERSFKIADPVDLTGDGIPELVVQKTLQGAHSDATAMGVFSVDGGAALRPVLPGKLYPGNWDANHGTAYLGALGLEVKAPQGRRAYIELTDGVAGYAGAGVVQRPAVHRWEWNPETKLIEPVPAEEGGKRGGTGGGYYDPKLRLYRFSDALYALEAKEPERARRLFEEVISGADVKDTLADKQAADTNPQLRSRLRAQIRQYAFFMLARLAMERGASRRLARVKRRLEAAFPDSPVLGAIDALSSEYDKTGSMAIACKRKTPVAHRLFGEQWAFRHIFGDHPAVKFEPGFGRRQLCVGLEPPE